MRLLRCPEGASLRSLLHCAASRPLLASRLSSVSFSLFNSKKRSNHAVGGNLSQQTSAKTPQMKRRSWLRAIWLQWRCEDGLHLGDFSWSNGLQARLVKLRTQHLQLFLAFREQLCRMLLPLLPAAPRACRRLLCLCDR